MPTSLYLFNHTLFSIYYINEMKKNISLQCKFKGSGGHHYKNGYRKMILNITFNDGTKEVSLYNNSNGTEFEVVNGTSVYKFTNKDEALIKFRDECGLLV